MAPAVGQVGKAVTEDDRRPAPELVRGERDRICTGPSGQADGGRLGEGGHAPGKDTRFSGVVLAVLGMVVLARGLAL
jgi:hypothetical protein